MVSRASSANEDFQVEQRTCFFDSLLDGAIKVGWTKEAGGVSQGSECRKSRQHNAFRSKINKKKPQKNCTEYLR